MNKASVLGVLMSCLAMTAPQNLVAASILRIDEVSQAGWKNQLAAGRTLKPQAADAQQTVSVGMGSRQYTLDLVSNTRLLERMPVQQRAEVLQPTVELWRGSIRGMSGSWVRLLRTPGGLHGAMFDGAVLFRITTLGDIRKQLVQPSELPDGRIVACSMNDVIVNPGTVSCEVRRGLRSASAANSYAQLDRELSTLHVAYKPGAARQLDISVLVDNAAFAAFPGVREIALDSAGIADGIFSEQLGLELRVTSFAIVPASEPLMAGTDVLEGAAAYREDTSTLQGSGVTYVFTGRSLGGDVLGQAFLNGACDPVDGVAAGVVEERGLMGIVMAHEVAHSLGAIHDGEESCASAPSGYLMAPAVTGSRQFSQCSLDALQPQVAARSCIGERQPAYSELEIRLATPTKKLLLNDTTRVEFEIHNRGYEHSLNAHLLIDVPASLEAQNSISCEPVAATQIDCLLGQLPPTESANLIYAVVTPREVGQFNLGAHIESGNEGPGPFDRLSHDFEVVRGIMVGATLQPTGGRYVRLDAQSARMELGDEVMLEAAAVNGLGRPRAHTNLTLTMPANWPVSALDITKGSCNLIRDARGTVLDCDVGVLPPSDVTTDIAFVRFTTKPLAGTHQVRVAVTDAEGGQNIAAQPEAVFNLTVDAPATPPPPPVPPPPSQNGGSAQSGGGGGGSFSGLALLLLLIAWWRRAAAHLQTSRQFALRGQHGRRMKSRSVLAVAAFVMPLLAAAADKVIIDHATVIEGTGAAPQANMAVIVEGDKITAVMPSQLASSEKGRRIDATGKYLIPGLMDVHIHLRGAAQPSGPGAEQPQTNRVEAVAALASYLYAGVTTIYDAGNRAELILPLRADERAGRILSPRIFATGSAITYPGSHGDRFAVRISDFEKDKALLDAHIAEQRPDMVKLMMEEEGWGARPMITLLTADLAEKIARYYNQHGIRTTVHVSNEFRSLEALYAGIDTLAHPIIQGPVSDSFVKLMAVKRTPFASTLTIGENYSRLAEHPEYLEQPLYAASLSPAERNKLQHETRAEYQARTWTAWMKLMTPVAQENIRKIHAAGGVVACGTDQSSGPAVHRELELLAAAGIAPLDVIRIATHNSAVFLGKDDQLGSVRVGKLADLVLLSADPSTDIDHAKAIVFVMKNGAIIDESKLPLAGGKQPRRFTAL